jgi:dihydrofolate reductase
MSIITIIAAAAENNELGLNNQLVWHLPDDFGRFKALTTGHHIIMGRKTFESFPKPLPNRTHIVITRDTGYPSEGIVVVHSLEEALKRVVNDPQPFVLGGGEIYAQAMEIANRIELTRVHGTFDADTFFPDIPASGWKLTTESYHPKDARHDYAFTYETWDKK